jgi:hypothetical protein
VHLRVHLVIGNCESSIMVLFELIISIFFICCFLTRLLNSGMQSFIYFGYMISKTSINTEKLV